MSNEVGLVQKAVDNTLGVADRLPPPTNDFQYLVYASVLMFVVFTVVGLIKQFKGKKDDKKEDKVDIGKAISDAVTPILQENFNTIRGQLKELNGTVTKITETVIKIESNQKVNHLRIKDLEDNQIEASRIDELEDNKTESWKHINANNKEINDVNAKVSKIEGKLDL